MKKLYIALLAIALMAAMVIPTGAASACPQPWGRFMPVYVSGSMEIVSWPFQDIIYTVDETTGDYVASNSVITWAMHGDLEGTYVEDITLRGNISDPYHFTKTADETFEGTLRGQPVSYRAKQVGQGTYTIPPTTPEAPFEGSESWFSWVGGFQSDVRGSLFFKHTWAQTGESCYYWGTLFWQRMFHW